MSKRHEDKSQNPNGLFSTGQIVTTPGALHAVQEAGKDVVLYLARHVTGDWGDVCDDDWQANDAALKDGTRIFSVYFVVDDIKIWIITEADRSSTCVLLPEEY